MFSSGTEFLQEVAGVSGSALVPTRFVWPYGGRRVFLTGSFTRSVLSSFLFTSVNHLYAVILFLVVNHLFYLQGINHCLFMILDYKSRLRCCDRNKI